MKRKNWNSLPGAAVVSAGWLLLLLSLSGAAPARAADLLTAGPPVILTETHGRFDFLTIDPARRRLLAAHTGNGSLDVIDLDPPNKVKSVATGHAQSSVVDARKGLYYVTSSEPPQVAIVDAEKLEVVGTIPVDGPADLLAFDPGTGHVYAGHDDGSKLWVIDPEAKKITASIALPSEAPEDLGFNPSHTILFQSMKKGSIIAVIDVATGIVVKTWPTAPVESPHGLAFLPDEESFLVAGGNGTMVLMSQKDGHVLASTPIALRVDQIAYDATLHRVYGASGNGTISVAEWKDGALRHLGEVTSAAGAHSIAVDPQTHTVWIAYARGETSFVQAFTPVP